MTTERLTQTERIARLEGAYEHLATKADIAELRGEFQAEISRLEGHIDTRIAELESRLLRWLVPTILGSVSLVVAIDRLLG